MIKKLYYGASYYPELWDSETMEEDIRLMKKVGINEVRMGEFTWSTLEPHCDEFQMEFLESIIDKFYENGIVTVLCTPTPTPPVWLSHKHPERMIVDENNITMVHGGRQQVCTNNDFFRKRSTMIVEKMAKSYGSLPGVIAWQLDNEVKGNVAECYCETCKQLWHQWLAEKYDDIDQLNTSWNTHIWSQYYEVFEQIPQPFKTPMGHSPSLVTAYRMFSREMAAEFLKEQAEVIRKYSNLPITHNSSLNHFIDNEKTFKDLDFIGFDHYSTSDEYYKMLSWLDTFKTLKNKPFWVMETAANYSACAYGYQSIHNNGYIKAEAAAAYALGAEGFNYWLWRQQRSGFEQTHGHIISSWGEPGVGFDNVVETGELKAKLEQVLSKTVPAKAELAVTYSDRARAFFMSEPLENSGFDYVSEMMKWYHMILHTGIHRDFIFEHHNFEDYKILMSPFLPYLSEDYMNRATEFVENGGVWVVGPLTGIRTVEQTVHTNHALGKLEELAGIRTVFHYPITGSGAIGNAFGIKAELIRWSSVFECTNAEVIGSIEGGVTPGLAFITECKRGRGKIVVIGSMPEGDQGTLMLRRLLIHYAKEASITMSTDVTPGTIVVPRKGENFLQWVIINMDGKGGEVTLPSDCKDAFIDDAIGDKKLHIDAYACKVIEFCN